MTFMIAYILSRQEIERLPIRVLGYEFTPPQFYTFVGFFFAVEIPFVTLVLPHFAHGGG